MASIFNSMPDFQSFNNSWQNSQSQNSPTPSDSSWNARSPFLQQVNYNTPTMPDVSAPTGGGNPLSAAPSGNSSGGFFSNLWQGIVNGGETAMNFIGQKYNDFEHATGLDRLGGVVKGISDPTQYFSNPVQNDGSYLGAYKSMAGEALAQFENLGKSAYEGFMNPQETANKFSTDFSNATQNMDPVTRTALSFEAGAGTDPLTFIPVGSVLSAAGKGIQAASDAAKITPYVQSAVDAVKSSAPAQTIANALGSRFVKNYGVTPEAAQGLQSIEGAVNSDKMALHNYMTDLAQTHGLTPDEVNQLPEVFQDKGITDNPKLAQAYLDLNHAMYNGIPLSDSFKIGTNAETSTMFNGHPILDPEKLIKDIGYYPQRYSKDINPQMEQKMEQLLQDPQNKGFSTTGPFGKERLFPTVGDAEANGFNPERNAYAAIAQRLAESSKTLRTAQFLQNMLDSGVIAKDYASGLKPSEIRPLSSFYSVMEKNPTGSSPLSQALNESGAAFKPLTKLDDTGFSLPKELSKSAPRYRSNTLNFESPLDKAAYIVGNTTSRSARDADFIKALTQHTGLSDPELRSYGQYMRSQVRSAANGVADGERVSIPRTLGNLPEHAESPLSAAPSNTNDFTSLSKTLEDSSPAEKVVKVNPYYVKPADEGAINEYLNPSKPSGIFGLLNKGTNLYNRYSISLNPMPHLHNITTNGMVLGEAKPSYVADAFRDIKNGVNNPWYEQTVRSGAVSSMRGENLMKSVSNAMKKKGKLGKTLDAINYARHDALWNADSAIRTALFRQAKEAGMGDADAAAKVNKFMVDYNNVTPFEKKFIKPVIPFYAWKKSNTPLQVGQSFAQTPKYVAEQHAKNAISQTLSGEPTDDKGRIKTGIKLPDGSEVAVDPYLPMDEPGKIMNKGILSYINGSTNPFIKEAESQLGLGSFPVKYDSQAPMDYNARQGIAHAINSLNPFSGSTMAGQIGNTSNGVNNTVNFTFDHLGGNPVNDIKTKDVPGQTSTELATKLLGSFTARDNPQKDALNQKYQNRQNILDQIKYLKNTGQTVPKSLQRQAYKKIK